MRSAQGAQPRDTIVLPALSRRLHASEQETLQRLQRGAKAKSRRTRVPERLRCARRGEETAVRAVRVAPNMGDPSGLVKTARGDVALPRVPR